VRKMSISENYEGSVTLIGSDISTFSRGTVSIRQRRARAVLLGRLYMWGLAVAGEEGV
jgi:hypothetical protein